MAALVGDRLDGNRVAVRVGDRGPLKQALLRLGWPAADEAGYVDGDALEPVHLSVELRSYQAEALAAWWADGSPAGGNGVLVLPCGAGKTVIGLAALVTAGAHTLIIATSITSARQWRDELLDKTDLDESLIGEYSGERKEIRPVTIATYQVLTWARRGVARDADMFERHPHLALFDEHQWGLVIYDEVHLLPAPVFRATARIQAVRRLGLTATLVREDGQEDDVFSLIGPKRYDVPWRELEALGWIAPAVCTEVRVHLDDHRRMAYAVADPDRPPPGGGHRPRQAGRAGPPPGAPPWRPGAGHRPVPRPARRGGRTVRGAAPHRPDLADGAATSASSAFRAGELPVLVVSKVANFSIDLPDANVAIQLSGQFGSRQEEAQRLGRIMRPKADGGPGPLLHDRGSRDRGAGLRAQPPTLPGRAGLRVPHPRRLRPLTRASRAGLQLRQAHLENLNLDERVEARVLS